MIQASKTRDRDIKPGRRKGKKMGQRRKLRKKRKPPPRSCKAQAWLDAILSRGTRTAGEDAEAPAAAD